jgi:hypothetical protein
MLQKLSKQAAECYRLARNAKEKAERTPDEAIRRDYLALERRWVKLAQSYELSERVSSFNSEVKRRIAVFQPRTPPHPALPSAVCPACGKIMRLAQVAPASDGHGQDMTLRCGCGHQLTRPFADEV